MAVDLGELVRGWDKDFESSLAPNAPPEMRRPFGQLLDPLPTIAALRFQPYQNDRIPDYIEKLRAWLDQFAESDRKAAFLLANRVLFVTWTQFDSLRRRLFRYHVKPHLLEAIIGRLALEKHDYLAASKHFDQEMDATIFVANSDSSGLNSFVHVNYEDFPNYGARRLVGPEAGFWTYAGERAQESGAPLDVVSSARDYESRVLSNDRLLRNKTRMVVVEDFAGSGSDLAARVRAFEASRLSLKEIVIAPTIATETALKNIESAIAGATRYTYKTMTAFKLSQDLQCFGTTGPSYLDANTPLPDLSKEVEALSTRMFVQHFASSLSVPEMHGFHGLALAFVHYANCPDNSLPLLWKETKTWPRALFPRVSRYL